MSIGRGSTTTAFRYASGLRPRLRYYSVRQHAIENHRHPGGIDGRPVRMI
jgi:hypothetical protein